MLEKIKKLLNSVTRFSLCLGFVFMCLVIYEIYKQNWLLLGLMIVLFFLILCLINRFNYEKIEEKLEIIGKVNSGVIVIATALIAYINNTKKGEDIFEPFVDAVFTIILLFPFISAFIFFQIYMEKKKKENGFLGYKVAFFLLYSSIMVVFLFFFLIICENIKPIL